jgi:hypothetical protein
MHAQREATDAETPRPPYSPAVPSPRRSPSTEHRAGWNWQTEAIAEYARTCDDTRRHPRRRLAERLNALIGCTLDEQTIIEDASALRATAAVDGTVFRLCGSVLMVARPCSHCGTGVFESAPIVSGSDLGYALAGWRPYHHDCEPADPAEDVSW